MDHSLIPYQAQVRSSKYSLMLSPVHLACATRSMSCENLEPRADFRAIWGRWMTIEISEKSIAIEMRVGSVMTLAAEDGDLPVSLHKNMLQSSFDSWRV